MGLIVSNRITDKQRAVLERLEYVGNWDLTIEEAAAVVDELFAEQRLHRDEYEPDLFNDERN